LKRASPALMLAASVGISCEKELEYERMRRARVKNLMRSANLYFIVASLGIRFY
jgi:hypothetical protein